MGTNYYLVSVPRIHLGKRNAGDARSEFVWAIEPILAYCLRPDLPVVNEYGDAFRVDDFWREIVLCTWDTTAVGREFS